MPPTEKFLLHVGKRALYTLSSDLPPGKELTIPRKGELKIVVKATRLEGGKGHIIVGPPGRCHRASRSGRRTPAQA